jgi:hypothetical protein
MLKLSVRVSSSRNVAIILKRSLETTREIDGFISAELPNPELHPLTISRFGKKLLTHSCDDASKTVVYVRNLQTGESNNWVIIGYE